MILVQILLLDSKVHLVQKLSCKFLDLITTSLLLFSANETMGDLIQAKFTNFQNYDADYPSMSGLVDKSALPLPKSTRASTMVAEKSRNDQTQKSIPEKRFVMKKFQNVPGKLNLPKPGSRSPQSHTHDQAQC